MEQIEVLVVGPAGHDTGGIAQYIQDQREELPETIQTRVFDVAVPKSETRFDYLKAGIRALGQAATFPGQEPADVVHVHSSNDLSFYQSSLYVFYAALVWDVPVVLHVHGSGFDRFVEDASGHLRAFQAATFAAATSVVVLSEYWRDIVSDRTDEEKIDVVPNAVNVDRYDPTFDTDPPHVVFVSNLIERKGVVEFLRAIEGLMERSSLDFEVTIAGDGPLSDRVEALAANNEEVTYEGYVSEERKRELLSEGSLFVLPTYAEGLPIAILEAMAGGNAVVSTPVGGIPSAVDDDIGGLVEPGDADALADEIASLIAEPDRLSRLAEESRRRAEENYSWNVVTAKLRAIYRRTTD